MVTIHVLYEFRESAIGVVNFGLTLLTLEVFFLEIIEEFSLQNIFVIDHLAPLLKNSS